MRLLAISGSLRAVSSNTAALLAAARLAPEGVTVALYDGLGALPLFNPDLDTEAPPAGVMALRREIERCDGVLICSPEYAHGIAGAMKNLLDWLVSSLEFPQKPVALINASPRAVHSQAQLREILTTMSARLIEGASIELPLQGRGLDAAGIVSDPALSAALRGAVETFADAIAEAAPATIRLAWHEDAARLPDLEQSAGELFRTAPGLEWVAGHENTPAEFYGPLIDAGTVWVAVDRGDTPVGFVSAEEVGDTLHVWELAVDGSRQGQGIGRRLMGAARGQANDKGLSALTLTTFRNVAWNAPFYQRLGYVILEGEAVGPYLASHLRDEIARGLPAERRCAMRLDLGAKS